MTCIKRNRFFKYRMSGFIRLLAVLPVFLCVTSCWAGSVSLVTYFPEPKGVYDRINLIPSTLTSACSPGTLMTESSTGNIKYCSIVSGAGSWGMLSNLWTQSGTTIYPTDTDTNSLIMVGVGTTNPGSKLSLDNDGGILALGTPNSGTIVNYDYLTNNRTNTSPPRFLWYPRKAAFRAVVDSTRVTDDGAIGMTSAAFGKDSAARGVASMAAGQNNNASADYSLVAGGLSNTASALYATVTGGQNNTASGKSSIVSGSNNLTDADFTGINGGASNTIKARFGTIGGGSNNKISAMGDYSTIAGGQNNLIERATGYSNTVQIGVISGGLGNSIINGDGGSIAGGSENVVNQSLQFVGGGRSNNQNPSLTTGIYSVIDGGHTNNASGDYSVVTGGDTNTASATYSTVMGGKNNTASGDYSVVAGGTNNNNYSYYSVIAGGDNNSINGGPYSFAAGRHMTVSGSASRTFVWGYSDTNIITGISDAFIIAAGTESGSQVNPRFSIGEVNPTAVFNITYNGSQNFMAVTSTPTAFSGHIFAVRSFVGYVGIGNNNPLYPLQIGHISGPNGVLTPAGIWTVHSSRKNKENIVPLESRQALDVFSKLNPVTYNYKINNTERHVGFIAEDVPDLVAVENRDSVNSMSVTAVLAQVLKEQKKQLRRQNELLDDLEKEAGEIRSALRRGGPSKSHP